MVTFLEKFIKMCDYDEMLFGLAVVIGELVSFFKRYAIKILDKLLVNEETVIREAAIKSYIKVLEYVSKSELSNVIIPEILKLKSKKTFPPKISALNLMTEIYPSCSN